MAIRPAAERAGNEALVAAKREANERYPDSPTAMLAAAAELRRNASDMGDSNDRNAMIRLATAYEQRADDAVRMLKRRQASG